MSAGRTLFDLAGTFSRNGHRWTFSNIFNKATSKGPLEMFGASEIVVEHNLRKLLAAGGGWERRGPAS